MTIASLSENIEQELPSGIGKQRGKRAINLRASNLKLTRGNFSDRYSLAGMGGRQL